MGNLADFFEAAYKHGLRDLNLSPIVVQQGHDSMLIHEIGYASSTFARGPYYVRWENLAGEWKIATDIMAIGASPGGTAIPALAVHAQSKITTPLVAALGTSAILVGVTVLVLAQRRTDV